MLKAWLTTRKDRGFSVVEVLLAVTIFGLIVMAIVGALIYGRNSTARAGDRIRANYLAEEGLEAARNIEGSSYANLTPGTFGLSKAGGIWSLSGSADTNDGFTRSLSVALNGANRKTVTSRVEWTGVNGIGTTNLATQMTNWASSITKLWSNPSQYSSLDVTGTIAGYKVATAGSYAYLVRNSSTGPNFFVINITNPTSPTVVGSLTLSGAPTNIAVSGNYAYISNSLSTAELQIVNIATPTAPALVGTYNASGSAGGLGVFAVGTTVYLTRAANSANNEFIIINAATPSAPTRITGYNLNVAMNEVYVSGTTAYIATASDTQELLVINLLLSPILSLGTAVNLPGTTDATTISGYGSLLTIGQGTSFYSVSTATLLAPVVIGTATLSGTIFDVDAVSSLGYTFVGTNAATAEFQVINVAVPATPTLLSSVNMTGSLSVTGIDYNATYDVVPAAVSNTTGEAAVFGPN